MGRVLILPSSSISGTDLLYLCWGSTISLSCEREREGGSETLRVRGDWRLERPQFFQNTSWIGIGGVVSFHCGGWTRQGGCNCGLGSRDVRTEPSDRQAPLPLSPLTYEFPKSGWKNRANHNPTRRVTPLLLVKVHE